MTNTGTKGEKFGRIAIVGAGQAAAWAAHTLRAEKYAGEIVLVGEEHHLPYERPFLSKGLLLGEQGPSEGEIFSRDYWEEISVDCVLGSKVTALDLGTQSLCLDDKRQINWDMLLLCTGGRARTVALAGACKNVLTLRTVDDALALRKKLESARTAVVIGGGWIGLEAAASASKLGVAVTVLEQGNRLCQRSLPVEASAWLKSLHDSHGVKVECAVDLSDVSDLPDGRISITSRDGRQWTADLVIAGVGMIPNDELAREAGLNCEAGIVVDQSCRTSHHGVFAAGDVASSYNSAFGRHLRMESWQNAQDQGTAAAKAMLGLPITYDLLPWFWSDQHGRNLQMVGVPAAGERVEMSYPAGVDGGALLWSYFKDDQVVGAVGIDAARPIRSLRKMLGARAVAA